MGVVYRAWQPSLGRQVALKCMLKAGDPKAEARFAREIRALGRVEHPNLVKVFTSGVGGEQWFYAMELVEGATLAAVCGQLQSQRLGRIRRGSGHVARLAEHRLQGSRSDAERPLSSPDDAERDGPADRLDATRSARPWTAATSATSSSSSARWPRRRTRCTKPA